MYFITKFLLTLVQVLRFFLCICMYSQVAYCEIITLPCINMIYVLCMYCIHKLSTKVIAQNLFSKNINKCSWKVILINI
jgi:hypothetical protein